MSEKTRRVLTAEQKTARLERRRVLNKQVDRILVKRDGSAVKLVKTKCYICEGTVDKTMVLEQKRRGATRHAHSMCLKAKYPRPHALLLHEYQAILEDALCERVRETRLCTICGADITYHHGLCRAVTCMKILSTMN